MNKFEIEVRKRTKKALGTMGRGATTHRAFVKIIRAKLKQDITNKS
jgi:hypothetical protein